MITIVDYQMGNLRSVQKGVERVGGTARITSDPAEVASAEKLILPGVGAFGDAMAEINKRDLADPIREFIGSGRPFLGICLGLQLLFERGFEHGEHEGLGVLQGDVVKFDAPMHAGQPLKVPHMGWNQVTRVHTPDPSEASATSDVTDDIPLLAGIPDGSHFYFVHSYYVCPADRSVVALECDYGGNFCAMVRRKNLFATQFHPEKSQANGLKILDAFVGLAGNESPHRDVSPDDSARSGSTNRGASAI